MISIRKLCVCVCLLLLSIMPTICLAMSPNTLAPQEFDKSKYGRVGILITRTGGAGLGAPNEITLNTNYANRIPSKETNQPRDVYIETDSRLKEVIPEYPIAYSLKRGGLFKFTSEVNYYRNLSPIIQQTVSNTFREKGYQVIDVAGVSQAFNKPLSEMSIAEILTALKGSADALLVLHYTDFGNSYYDDQHVRRTDKGFSSLAYTLALFDVTTGEKLLKFEPFYTISIKNVLQNDQEIKANPELSKKLRYIDSPKEDFERGFFTRTRLGVWDATTTGMVFDVSEDDIIQCVMKYIRKGFKLENYNKWMGGLEQKIP